MEQSEAANAIVGPGYDEVAARYAELDALEQWPRIRWVRKLLERLPKGSTVLELGCGNGVPATQELSKRHHVVAVEISSAQIALARTHIPGPTFVQADASEIDFRAHSFDAIASFYTLDHIPRRRHEKLFMKFYRWLRPEGFLLISIEDSDQPDIVAEWLGSPMFFSHFDAETNRHLVGEAGFEVISDRVETQMEQHSEVPYWWLLAQKPRPTPSDAETFGHDKKG